jgi:hypothetical protein
VRVEECRALLLKGKNEDDCKQMDKMRIQAVFCIYTKKIGLLLIKTVHWVIILVFALFF